MENRLAEIQRCRAEIQSLAQQINDLSARVSALERTETVQPAQRAIQSPQPKPVPMPKPASTLKISQNLENKVGKNLFAIVASLLVLIGVCVFISTIYAYIPDAVKILVIFVLGFVLLGGGLALYLKNSNRFWLGVASCGLAELLVSIITAHSYFGVLSLGVTFGLTLLWVISAFWLTKFQPTVFKTIGYIGFIISILLGLSLLGDGDVPMYLMLLCSFAVLSAFFVVINPSRVKLNTTLAFLNVANLSLFLLYEHNLPDNVCWLSGALVIAILAAYHGLYLLRGKLHADAYPFFSILSMVVLGLFIRDYHMAVIIPMSLSLLFFLWFANHRVTKKQTAQVLYSVFAGVYIAILAMVAGSWRLSFWFAGFAVAAYGLYWLTKKRSVAWLGFVCFSMFYAMNGLDHKLTMVGIFAAALGVFAVLRFTKLLHRDAALEAAWYVLSFAIAHSLKSIVLNELSLTGHEYHTMRTICDGVFYSLLTIPNTLYLHITLKDPARIMNITPKGIVVMVVQGFLFFNCLYAIESEMWYIVTLGIVGSLLVASYSLLYTFKTRGNDKKLMVWQFVKFSLYCWTVLNLLESPGILVNITLLLIAIAAVIVGFKLNQKSVRIYGLVLSLLDVVCLILFNVDYSDSLKLAGGIVLCGVLCFVISFIYSRISKAAQKL